MGAHGAFRHSQAPLVLPWSRSAPVCDHHTHFWVRTLGHTGHKSGQRLDPATSLLRALGFLTGNGLFRSAQGHNQNS